MKEPTFFRKILIAKRGVNSVRKLSKPELKGKIGLFGGIDKAKFRRQIVPGYVLKIEVEVIK